jgi:hypothetical protein
MSGIEYVRLERDGVETCVSELRDAIFDVTDALATLHGEGQAAAELALALANIRKAQSWLDSELGNKRSRESEADHG